MPGCYPTALLIANNALEEPPPGTRKRRPRGSVGIRSTSSQSAVVARNQPSQAEAIRSGATRFFHRKRASCALAVSATDYASRTLH